MADIITTQVKFNGAGYVDSMMTVESYSDLADISPTNRFVGLTVTVLNTATRLPIVYWLFGGTTNIFWKVKTAHLKKYDDLNTIPSGATFLGLTVLIESDDNPDGGDGNPAEYWVTSRVDGIVTWERKSYGVNADIAEKIMQLEKVASTSVINYAQALETADVESKGQIINIENTTYSYVNNSGETIYVMNEADIPLNINTGEKVPYEIYENGTYVVIDGGSLNRLANSDTVVELQNKIEAYNSLFLITGDDVW